MYKIILIAGKKRSGKDTLAKFLSDNMNNSIILRFADPMKSILATTLGISLKELEDGKNNEDACTKTLSYREVLQNFGSEGMKPFFGEDVWGKLMVHNIIIALDNTVENIIIPDFRFEEEFEVLRNFLHRDNVSTVLVERPNLTHNDSHSSENSLNNFDFDYKVVNNGTIEEYAESARDLMSYLKDITL